MPEPLSDGVVRPLSPLQRARVEFWDPGEDASNPPKPLPAKAGRLPHSKRADKISIAMAVIAILLVVMITVMVSVLRRSPQEGDSTLKKTISPTVDFYLGNRVFDQKVKKEKEHNLNPDSGTAELGAELQVSLQDQMTSMKEKLEKMRLEKSKEELPTPSIDRGDLPAQLIKVNPVDISNNFISPAEFIQNLPKSLQQDSSQNR